MVHGVTWSVTVDAMLDELPDLTLARIALLR